MFLCNCVKNFCISLESMWTVPLNSVDTCIWKIFVGGVQFMEKRCTPSGVNRIALSKTRMKGVPNLNLKTFTSETAELLRCGKGSLISQTNTMKRTIDGPISLTRENKRLKLALHPRKRCFKSSGQHSLPWC